ncbi:MAG: Hsp70 family protein [Aestuariibacter sp.]
MKYVIGVDLGTTNIVVSYSKVADDNGAQTVFPIKQLVAPGQIQALPMLPALRYHYTSELTEEQVRLPWQLDNYNASLPAAVIGRYAAELGSRNPQRLVVSAKSWLSFRAESNSEIQLPDKADEQIDTITPMESTASYLNYLRSAWDHEFPEAPFTQQSIVVTVPASFDDMARALTIEAINRAGIKDFRLLEEPQAACYHWLADNDVQTLNNSKHLMVCDIGGGTTDFTLIKVDNKGGELPQLERIGVGDHLMLGGDNMDLALAARVLQKLQQPVSPKNLNKLLTRCQLAKEQLLATDGPNELPIQFQSAGSQLFSNTQETRLTQKEVQQTILDGFFPEVACEAKPKTRKKALTDFSLPYPSDAGITRHIAAFLAEQQVALAKDHAYALPDTWLLNGGPFLSSQIEARLKSVVHSWQSNDTNWLRNPEPQTAVAKGAVQYGMALHKQTTLIKSAVVRHYFLKVSSDSGYKAVCILPKFSEPNSRITLDREFKLTKGKPVKFEVGYLLSEEPYHNGSIIDWHEKIHQLPSLETQIQGAGSTTIRLTTELDELGVLNVVMQEQDSEENWQLNFNIRQDKNTNKQEQLSSELVAALQVIEHWFGSAAVELPKEPLRKSLEKLLGPRENWSGNIARQLFDKLLDGAKKR